MKSVFTILAFALLLASCSSTKKTTTATVTTPGATASNSGGSGNDGSNYEKAIVIDKKNESDGIAEEYKWLKKNYPGYTLIKQSLQHKDKKSYDVMHIKTSEGEEKHIYFDITNFFGKF